MLLLAASYGHRELAAYLIKLGMDVMLKNEHGKIPVDLANKFGQDRNILASNICLYRPNR